MDKFYHSVRLDESLCKGMHQLHQTLSHRGHTGAGRKSQH